MDYTEILKYLFSTAVIAGGIIYIAKVLIDKFFETRVERFKNSLQKDTEVFINELNLEAEKFRHSLNTATIEHQIKYSKLYEERGNIIKLLYSLLLGLEKSLAHFTTMHQGPDWKHDKERENKVSDCIDTLQMTLADNRIFFSEDLCLKIESILSDSNKIIVEMNTAKLYEQRNESYDRRGEPLGHEELMRPLNTWKQLDVKVQNEIKAATADLTQEFRKLIGVS